MFCTTGGQTIMILHAFIKKTQKTPQRDLELARRRLREVRLTTHDEMIATWKKDPRFARSMALEEEFAVFDALVSARQQAGLTQTDVAERWAPRRQQLPA